MPDEPLTGDDVPIELFLDRYPPAIRDTGLRLRELIRIAVPEAVEGIRSGWSWVGYGLPDRRAKRTFAWIGPERKHSIWASRTGSCSRIQSGCSTAPRSA